MEDELITVQFVSLKETSFSMKVLESETVGQVKERIYQEREIPIKTQILSFPVIGGQTVLAADDHRQISEFVPGDGSSVIVLFDSIDVDLPPPSPLMTSAAAADEEEEEEVTMSINLEVDAKWKTKMLVDPTWNVGSLKTKIGEEESTTVESITVVHAGIQQPDTQIISGFSDLKVRIRRCAHPLAIKLIGRYRQAGGGGDAATVRSLWKNPMIVNAEEKLSSLRLRMQKAPLASSTFSYPVEFVFSRGYELLDEEKTYAENGVKDGERIYVFDIGNGKGKGIMPAS